MTNPAPTTQLTFLKNIQRLLADGKFTATYKYALIYALADLSVSEGSDSNEPLTLTTRQIAERFFEMYDRQSIQFPGSTRVLLQNSGKQSAIINKINEARATYSSGGNRAKRQKSLITNIDGTVRKMPLCKLQRVGDDVVDFLYAQPRESDREITLHNGIAACFRTFYPLITATIQGAWIQAVRNLNPVLLGEKTDLYAFMFGATRSNLNVYREVLRDVQNGKCFYTGSPLGNDSEVDHFVPWSRYPVDLGHNFVLASRLANNSKCDSLASEQHLDKWIRQVTDHRNTLEAEFQSKALRYDLAGSLNTAIWAYSMASSSSESVWQNRSSKLLLSGQWERMLAGAIANLA